MSERREAILRASATAIAERGVRGLRVSDVAQVAGVSPGLLYYHFKDRDGLLSAALTYINDQARAYRTAADGTGAPRDRLVNHLLAEIQDTPEVLENSLAWNELRAAAVYERPLREPLARTSRQWNGEVADTVDPDETGLIITTLTEGLSSRWLTGELTTEQARTHLRAAIDALLPRRTTKPRTRHAPTH